MRPHETSPDLLYLSFRASNANSTSNSQPTSGSTTVSSKQDDIKHAILRKEVRMVAVSPRPGQFESALTTISEKQDPNDATSSETESGAVAMLEEEVVSYRCGKIGPCPTLYDLLV